MPGYEGRWLAGLAPVGCTGYVVIVQTRYDKAIESNKTLARGLLRYSGGALAFGLTALLSSLLVLRRRNRARLTL